MLSLCEVASVGSAQRPFPDQGPGVTTAYAEEGALPQPSHSGPRCRPPQGRGGRTLEGVELVAYFVWFKNVLEYLWGFPGGSESTSQCRRQANMIPESGRSS